jgi:hypothetical protein
MAVDGPAWGDRRGRTKLGSSVMTGEAMGDDSRSSTTISIHLPPACRGCVERLVGGMVGMVGICLWAVSQTGAQ